MKYRIIAIAILFSLLVLLTPATAIRSRGIRGEPYTTIEGFFGIKFRHQVNIPQFGDVIVETDYSSTINLSSWKITDNKDIVIEMNILSKPNNLSLWVEHMHADVFLESTLETWDGVMQDVMDDKYHSDMSYGFYIDTNYGYSETFSIEGLSQMLTSYHSYYYAHHSETYRLKESELISKFKVYGSSFRIIYDIVFRHNSWPEEQTPKFIVEDNIILNLKEGWQGNIGDLEDKPAELDPITKFFIWLDSPWLFYLPIWLWLIAIIIVLIIVGVILYMKIVG